MSLETCFKEPFLLVNEKVEKQKNEEKKEETENTSEKREEVKYERNHHQVEDSIRDTEDRIETEKKKYIEYLKSCFNHLLQKDDEYILETFKVNDSLKTFFLEYFNGDREKRYDLTYDETTEDIDYSNLENLIFKLYFRILDICITIKNEKTDLIKSEFFNAPILMDALSMSYEKNKQHIKDILQDVYEKTKFKFLNMKDYLGQLYKELTSLREIIIFNPEEESVEDILFKINDFIHIIMYFFKCFRNYQLHDSSKNFLLLSLMGLELFLYGTAVFENKNRTKNNTEELDPELDSKKIKHEQSFFNLFIQTYFDLIDNLYKKVEISYRKQLLFLRSRFILIIRNLLKYLIFSAYPKNTIYNVYMHVVDTLKEKCTSENRPFLLNDTSLSNWNFLQLAVIQEKLDFEYYSYINNTLNLFNTKQEIHLIKKKYETDIQRIKEITHINDEHVIVHILKNNNFDVSSTVNHIFHMDAEEIQKIQKEEIKWEDLKDDESEIDSSSIDENEDSEYETKSGSESEDETNEFVIRSVKDLLKAKYKNTYVIKKKNKDSKQKYVKEQLTNEAKEKIMNLLNMPSSGSEGIDDFENEFIEPTSYNKNYISEYEEDLELQAEDQNENSQQNINNNKGDEQRNMRKINIEHNTNKGSATMKNDFRSNENYYRNTNNKSTYHDREYKGNANYTNDQTITRHNYYNNNSNYNNNNNNNYNRRQEQNTMQNTQRKPYEHRYNKDPQKESFSYRNNDSTNNFMQPNTQKKPTSISNTKEFNNYDKEKMKKQYTQKTKKKGQYQRNQRDKKMSKGMF